MEPVSPADVRQMLRADAVSLAIGVLLVVVGVLALVLWAGARRRAASLPAGHSAGGVWIATFALLYGLRMLAGTDTFRLYFDVAPAVWQYATAALTYVVPIPLILFVRSFVPTWARFATFAAVGVGAFAAYGIASDVILQRPASARTANNLIAIALIVVLVVLFFRRGLTPSRELRIARVGVLTVSLTALADNLRGIGFLAFPGPELEPFGFTVLVICLGTLAAWRVLDDARRLVGIDRELSIARQIQSSILPQATPRISGVTVAARYRPMTAVAGDFYDFVEVDDQRLGVLVADVSGHGVPAALLASMVKIALAAQQGRAEQPATLLAGMNDALYGRLAGQFVTAAYLFIDGGSGLVRYAAAGHPPMLRLRRSSLEVCEVEKNGFALGFVPETDYPQMEHTLEPGDRLLLYTDGLIEAENAAEEFFGLARVKAALTAGAALPPAAAADALFETMNTWSDRRANDDLTIVLVDWAHGG
jgi:sigma-B regulation protein RsbU (phosphoserine phosphatase)